MKRKTHPLAMLETTLRIKHLRRRAPTLARARVTRGPMLTCAPLERGFLAGATQGSRPMNRTLRHAAVAAVALAAAAHACAGTLTLESWRTDDKTLWDTVLIPAFAKAHPGITVKFNPTAPP
jgi:hypothetical protein